MTNITRRQFCVVGTAATFAAFGLTGCGNGGQGGAASAGNGGGNGAYKDGTYTGRSSTMDAGVDGDGYGIITITVENGEIADATFEPFLPDGTPKDGDYGKDGSNYALAQRVVAAGDDYAKELVDAGDPEGVDATTGATFLYEQFIEATEDALSQAK